jgi:hypothetical protein
MEWFRSRIGVLPCMWNVAISNTPHCHLMHPMVFKIFNESRCMGYLVAMMSICNCTHKTRSWSNGQAFEYIIWPKIDNTFVQSSIVGICFTTYSAHVLCTCHKHKKTLASNQTLLHGKTSSIEISFYSSLIKCLRMSIKHEIKHVLMKTNAM